MLVLQQLREQNLTGVPYIDTRTFKEWLNVGRAVRKGEKSKVVYEKRENTEGAEEEVELG